MILLKPYFFNMFYQGKLKAMPPKLLSDDKRNILIRPLAYCRESDLIELAALKQFPIIPCNLCGVTSRPATQRGKGYVKAVGATISLVALMRSLGPLKM